MFERTIINAREKVLSSDHNAVQSQIDRSLRDVLMQMGTGRVGASNDLSATPVSGFIGDAFKVRPAASPGLSVVVAAGLGFQYLPGDVPAGIGGVPSLDDLSAFKPLPLLANQEVLSIPAGPSAGQDRYDIIEVRLSRTANNPQSRNTMDTLTGLFVSTVVNKSLAFTLDGDVGQVTSPASSTAAISYKVGSPVATGGPFDPANVPPVTPGYVKIATVFSQNGNMTSAVSKANLIDERQTLALHQQTSLHVAGSVPSGASVPATLTGFSAPPGMEVLMSKVAPPAQNRVKVWIIGGLGPSTVAPQLAAAGSVLSGHSGTAFDTLHVIDVTTGVLGAIDVATLADSTITANAQVLPGGTPYAAVELAGLHQSGGTTSDTVPDPMVFTATLKLTH